MELDNDDDRRALGNNLDVALNNNNSDTDSVQGGLHLATRDDSGDDADGNEDAQQVSVPRYLFDDEYDDRSRPPGRLIPPHHRLFISLIAAVFVAVQWLDFFAIVALSMKYFQIGYAGWAVAAFIPHAIAHLGLSLIFLCSSGLRRHVNFLEGLLALFVPPALPLVMGLNKIRDEPPSNTLNRPYSPFAPPNLFEAIQVQGDRVTEPLMFHVGSMMASVVSGLLQVLAIGVIGDAFTTEPTLVLIQGVALTMSILSVGRLSFLAFLMFDNIGAPLFQVFAGFADLFSLIYLLHQFLWRIHHPVHDGIWNLTALEFGYLIRCIIILSVVTMIAIGCLVVVFCYERKPVVLCTIPLYILSVLPGSLLYETFRLQYVGILFASHTVSEHKRAQNSMTRRFVAKDDHHGSKHKYLLRELCTISGSPEEATLFDALDRDQIRHVMRQRNYRRFIVPKDCVEAFAGVLLALSQTYPFVFPFLDAALYGLSYDQHPLRYCLFMAVAGTTGTALLLACWALYEAWMSYSFKYFTDYGYSCTPYVMAQIIDAYYEPNVDAVLHHSIDTSVVPYDVVDIIASYLPGKHSNAVMQMQDGGGLGPRRVTVTKDDSLEETEENLLETRRKPNRRFRRGMMVNMMRDRFSNTSTAASTIRVDRLSRKDVKKMEDEAEAERKRIYGEGSAV